MSRINTAKETLSSVLRGRETELSVKGEPPTHARAFFNMAYWRAEDYRDAMVALIKTDFEIVEWTVHGAFNGVQVELLILDKPAISRCTYPEVREISGCEDCPGWSKCPEEKVRY